jgi:hypothetical protein
MTDGGYCSEANLKYLEKKKIDRRRPVFERERP